MGSLFGTYCQQLGVSRCGPGAQGFCAIEVLRMGYISDIFRIFPSGSEGSNVQWRLGKIAFHIADKLRRQLTRQG